MATGLNLLPSEIERCGEISLGLHERNWTFCFFLHPFVLIMEKVLALAYFRRNLPCSRLSHNFLQVATRSFRCSFVANSFVSPSPSRWLFLPCSLQLQPKIRMQCKHYRRILCKNGNYFANIKIPVLPLIAFK